jgi:hypothetical protein
MYRPPAELVLCLCAGKPLVERIAARPFAPSPSTACPRAINSRTMAEPIDPVPPGTRMRNWLLRVEARPRLERTRALRSVCACPRTTLRCTSAADLKLLRCAAGSSQELQIEKRHWNHKFASARNFPKFVKVHAAREHELRKAGTGHKIVSIERDLRKILLNLISSASLRLSPRFSPAWDVLTF